ncbi:MAG: feruloyl-CoA synthase [Alphaproteobacteria bacterium]|nr:feruloyl-CoA synthase [Alphaproteobacteria bacterium]
MIAGIAPFRPVRLGRFTATLQSRADGTAIVRPDGALGPYPRSIVDSLEAWAARTPDATLIAERDGDGWRRLSYAEVMARLPPLAQALLDAGISTERPLVVISGNEIEHFLLGMAAIWVGVPYAPISPAYSLISTSFSKLIHISDLLTPGMIYASDGKQFEKAMDAAFASDIPVIVRTNPPGGRPWRLFDDLLTTEVTDAVARAHDAITPDTIAKVLFTSGSTGVPKGVITTNRMMACNQEMIRAAWSFFAEEKPVLLDWMPWNHVAGGSHNTGIAIYNGGSFFIDDGKPTPGQIGATIRNIKHVQPTFFTNVPKGFEFLVAALDEDEELRRKFFSRLKLLQYAGASLSQHVFDGLERHALAELGQRIMIVTGYGSTETAPFALSTTWAVEEAGHIGLPAPGLEIKLVANGDKREIRLKGPNVTPGYWREPDLTKAAFDEDGFYKIGDAVRQVDENDINKGFIFDGRVSEDFKLSTGTWVNMAGIRTGLISACAPLIRDVVLTGLDRNSIGALLFPDLGACARLARLPETTDAETIVSHAAVRQRLAISLSGLAARATGSSNHVARALVMAVPPDIDKGEITDKGSINQRAVRAARADLVEALYAEPPGPGIFDLPRGKA